MEESTAEMEVTWDIIEEIAKDLQIPYKITKNVVNLLDNDNTVPFIARYRKEQTGDMEPDKIRQVKEVLSEFRAVKHRISTVRESIKKQGKLNPALNRSLSAATSMPEVEMLYAPYKPGSKRSLAERAREAGLESSAESILNNNTNIDLNTLIQPSSEDYSTESGVKKGLQYIIADIIAKNTEAKEHLNSVCQSSYIMLESIKTKKAAPTASKKEPKTKKGKCENSKKSVEEHKFQNYFEFKCSIKSIKPHQVLAINRGEDNKILSVKVVLPENIKRLYTIFCHKKWIRPTATKSVKFLIEESVSDAYDRLVAPQVCRQIRSDLTKKAEKASIEVFCSNLKNRLLVATVKHKVVLALDPGFFHGCKLAVISKTGKVLYTDILYLNSKANSKMSEEEKLSDIVRNYNCEIIAIGNGTACRETETKVSNLIKKKAFPNLNVCYCIVDESGASIYSVSNVAKDELPDMDHSLRGAVSIARRLQDPLAELVKIEPKHIGVGMYQHDVSESKLKEALDSIVGECVSFVGVDLNTSSEHLLRKVAGLNATQAKNIVAWRNQQGKFNNREQLKLIKGLGQKTFDQCAGFIRVVSGLHDSNEDTQDDKDSNLPKVGSKRKASQSEGSSKSKKVKLAVNSSINPLDRTWIHPESYHVAKQFIKKTGACIDDIGFTKFIEKVKTFMKTTDVKKLAQDLSTDEHTMKLIVDGLLQPINYDLRDKYEKPLFRTEITSLKDLTTGQKLSGRVSNVTHFGAFVDVGVGIDGLLHISKMKPDLLAQKNRSKLELGDRIEVMVDSLDLQKLRIGLSLCKFL